MLSWSATTRSRSGAYTRYRSERSHPGKHRVSKRATYRTVSGAEKPTLRQPSCTRRIEHTQSRTGATLANLTSNTVGVATADDGTCGANNVRRHIEHSSVNLHYTINAWKATAGYMQLPFPADMASDGGYGVCQRLRDRINLYSAYDAPPRDVLPRRPRPPAHGTGARRVAVMQLSHSAVVDRRAIGAATAAHDGAVACVCAAAPQSPASLLVAAPNTHKWMSTTLPLSLPDSPAASQPNIAFGSHARHIYLALPPARHLSVFSRVDSSPTHYRQQQSLQTDFDTPVFAVRTVLEHAPSVAQPRLFTVLVSESGQLAVANDSDSQPLLCQKTGFNLGVRRVISVSHTADNGCIAVIGCDDNHLHLYLLRLSQPQPTAHIQLSCSAPIQISDPPHHQPRRPDASPPRIAHFALNARTLCVLYEHGHLCFYHLRPAHSAHNTSASALPFFSAPFQSTPNAPSLKACVFYAMQLCATPPREQTSAAQQPLAGFVEPLWRDFFLVGYGRYVSVWDHLYVCGHAFLHLDHHVRAICAAPNEAGRANFVTERALHQLIISDRVASGAVTLAMVLKRKTICDEVVQAVTHGLPEAPLRSHPLSVAPIKAAAEADSDSSKLFETYLSGEDDREDDIIRQLLTKSKTPTAESVISLVHDYTGRNHGARGDPYNMGLSRIPSERLAAVTTARCLYELRFDQLKFLVPLVDMLGTGVVSNEAVLAVADVSDSWDMGMQKEAFRVESIIDPLMRRVQYSHALEAVVSTVSDLPEQDVVKVVQYATRLADAFQAEELNGDMSSARHPHNDSARVKRERARRLFEACLKSHTDEEQLIQALRKLPFSDVVTILDHLKRYLSTPTVADANTKGVLPHPLSVLQRGVVEVAFQQESAVSYRGMRNWVDHDKVTKRKRRAVLMKGCISWACCTIDAHLSTLILDESGRELAELLLQAVRDRRRESQNLKALQGLAGHLANGKAVPSAADALYNTRMVLLPRNAALL